MAVLGAGICPSRPAFGQTAGPAAPEEPQSAATPPASQPTSTGPVRYCNLKSILIRYRWQGPAPAGVQMWIRPDNQSWLPWQWTNRPSEPLPLTPPRQGALAIALAPAEKEMTGPPGPDAQVVSVIFDWSKPLLRLLAAAPSGAGSPAVRLTWSAWDENFGDRPISLYWRPTQEEPWRLGEGNLPNAGVYEWNVPVEAVGKNLQISLRAVDLAGNVAEAVAVTNLESPSRQQQLGATPGYGKQEDGQKTRQAETTVAVVQPREATPPVPPAPDEANAASLPPHPAKPAAAPSTGEQTATGEHAEQVLKPTVADSAPPSDLRPADSQPTAAAINADRLNELAQQQIAQGNLETAEDLLRQALVADPMLHAARVQLGILLQRRGQYQQAINEYEAVLATKPDNTTAWRNLALAYMSTKDYPKARVTLQKLLAVEANNAQTWLDLGDVEMLSGRPGVARQCWDKASLIGKSDPQITAKVAKRLKTYIGTNGNQTHG